ncbi:MAG: MarR family transcriptional regulator [Chloroflexota bacterium]|nr:MarR family transcriptional regulator [Chloroflexota bacterium]
MVQKIMPNSHLRFNGSLWVNLDISLRRLDQVIGRVISSLNLTIIEWYILRALFERDGQHASELARAVGRAATSFTPNLDKLQSKGLIERRPDPTDRRAVHIFLTAEGEKYRAEVHRTAQEVDTMMRRQFASEDLDAFLSVLADLQDLDIDQD